MKSAEETLGTVREMENREEGEEFEEEDGVMVEWEEGVFREVVSREERKRIKRKKRNLILSSAVVAAHLSAPVRWWAWGITSESVSVIACREENQ